MVLHQVEQVGAACDELRVRRRGNLPDGIGDVVCPRILKVDHDRTIACWIAATMFG